MTLSQRKVVLLRPGEKDGRADLNEVERDQERRAVSAISQKVRKEISPQSTTSNVIANRWQVTGKVVRLINTRLKSLTDFGKEIEPFELGTPEATVRYFVNEGGVSESISELYEDIFHEEYKKLLGQDIVSEILRGESKASDFSPSEVIAALFSEEMRERFLAELRPSTEARFFENFSHQYPQASIVMGSVWENYRHKIHGLAEKNARGDWKYSHFIFHDDDDDEVASVISDFSANGIRSIPGRAQKLLERPEKQFIQARHSVIRSALHEVVARYDQLAEITTVSLSDLSWESPSQKDVYKALFLEKRRQKALTDPGSMRAFVEQLRSAQEFTIPNDGKDDQKPVRRQVSAQWRAEKVGWLERFDTPLAVAFYDFCKHRNINARQLAHCVGTIASYDDEKIVRICGDIESALPEGVADRVMQWRSALLAIADDRASSPKHFVRSWQAVFGLEHECSTEEIAELQDNLLAVLALDYCFRKVFSEDGNSGGVLDDVSGAGEIVGAVQSAAVRLRQRSVHSTPAAQKYDQTVHLALGLSRHMRDALTVGLVSKVDEDKKVSKILQLFDNSRIMGVLSLSVFGEVIRDKEHNERIGFVRSLLEQSLRPVFDEVGIAKRDRSELLEDFTKRLLAMHLEGGEKPASVVNAAHIVGGRVEAQSFSDQSTQLEPLPENDPLVPWSKREKGESPVAFILRIYGDRMGRDPNLTKSYIRRVDRPLHEALRVWVKDGNPLPDDFDLPTKQEVLDREVAELEKGNLPKDLKDWSRLKQAQYRREKASELPSR